MQTRDRSGPPILIPQDALRRRVHELAVRIDADYADAGELVMLGVLRGAFIFLADLSRALTIPRRVDFLALSSYEDGQATGAVRFIMDTRIDLGGRHVLIVEDILDTGHTLHYLMQTLAAREPASLRSCVLVAKPRQEVEVRVDYLGFEIEERWVVGYGLDYADRYRCLPYVGTVDPVEQDGHGKVR